MKIRLGNKGDAAAIERIYVPYVQTSTCTWQEQPGTLEERLAWVDDHGPRHPFTVAVDEGGEIVGWAAISPFHRRSGYRFTVEDSVYVRADRHRRGVGRALLADLIDRARGLEYHTIVASITSDQAASIRLHAAFGFVETAHMPQMGFKFGRWHDLTYMQLTLR